MDKQTALVGIVMGSRSDWDTMSHAAETLGKLGIPYEAKVLSAHRTPAQAHEFAATAQKRGVKIVIAAAGGAAHLAGVMAANTVLPVLGVPMKGWSLDGLDSLLSTVQMPAGIPVGTLAMGKAGAINAALLAAAIRADAPAGAVYVAGTRPGAMANFPDGQAAPGTLLNFLLRSYLDGVLQEESTPVLGASLRSGGPDPDKIYYYLETTRPYDAIEFVVATRSGVATYTAQIFEMCSGLE